MTMSGARAPSPAAAALLGALLLATAGCDWMSTDNNPLPTSTISGDVTPPPPQWPGEDSREAAIAKCLTSRGAVLYGANWCPYTQRQIQSFKDGFRHLTYVECTRQAALCTQKGVDAYPTWIIRGGRIEGYRDVDDLAAYARCGI